MVDKGCTYGNKLSFIGGTESALLELVTIGESPGLYAFCFLSDSTFTSTEYAR